MAALRCDFTSCKDRYGPSALIFFLSPQVIVQGSDRRENQPFFHSSLGPRSVKAVCGALNRLIPYLWGSGTIYRSCNVIRGTGRRTGRQQVLGAANPLISSPDTAPFHIPPTSTASKVTTEQMGKIASSSRLSKSLQNEQISCKSPQLMCAGAAVGQIHLRQPGSPSRHEDVRRKAQLCHTGNPSRTRRPRAAALLW